MQPYKASSTFATPEILLDAQEGIFSFSGSSYPEDPQKVYLPVIDWFAKYVENPLPLTVVDFSYSYFSTSSTQLIFLLFRMLEELHAKGFAVKVCWHYSADNEEIQENGEDFAGLFDLPFELIEKS